MLIQNNVDVLTVAETKLDDSFPMDPFLLNGFKRPYRLDVSCNSGGLLTYINSDIPSRKLSFKIPQDVQIILIEINLRKMKWLIISIYRHIESVAFEQPKAL